MDLDKILRALNTAPPRHVPHGATVVPLGAAYSNIDQVLAAHGTATDLPDPEENR